MEFIDEFCSKEGKKPFIEVEYCHAMGNGPGDLEAYFERLYKYPGYIGGFVWEWCDHSVYMGKTIEGKDKFFYGGDWNEEIHDGNFCMDGLVYPDRTPHTGLLEHKNVARPIRAILLDASKGLVELDNKLDYTNIKDGFTITYDVQKDGMTVLSGTLDPVDCPAKEKVTITLPFAVTVEANTIVTLHYLQKEDALLTPSGYEAGHDQLIFSTDATSAVAAVAKASGASTASATSAVSVEDLENELVVSGSAFRYVYDKWKGTFTALVKDQKNLIAQPIQLNIWRAPMDNDRRIRWEWEAAGYDRARTKIYATEWTQDEDGVTLTSTYSLAAVYLQRIIEGTITWKVAKDGTLTVTVDGERKPVHVPLAKTPLPKMPFLPRFGLRLFLEPAFADVTYFGYGPIESYPDKHHDAKLGLYTSDVDSLHEDYLRPQENGSHWNCSGLALTTSDHRSLLISGTQNFSFNASRYTQEELTTKAHSFELEKSPYTVLCLDGYMSGCGSNSCGPALAKKYRVDQDKLTFTFTLNF